MASNVRAQVLDQRFMAVGRSYPVGVQANYTVGFNHGLWDQGAWKYGYLRLAMNAATSVVINRIGPELQFFPISIFGVSVGHDFGFRSFRPPFADCDGFECMGRVDRTYLRNQMVAAAAGFVFMFQGKYELLRHHGEGTARFFDEMTMLASNTTSEHILTLNPVLLYTLNDQWKIGAISLYSRGLDSGDSSHLWGPAAQVSLSSRSSFLFGAGQNGASRVHSALGVFMAYSLVIDPSLSIVDKKLRDDLK